MEHAVPALRWLEALSTPVVVAAIGTPSETKYRLYVPDNVADKVAKAWSGGREATIADYRTEKDVCPTHLAGDALHYLWPLVDGNCPHLEILAAAARSITHLGWGVDMVAADAAIITEEQAATLPGERWRAGLTGGTPLRVPVTGTLDALLEKHNAFLNRLGPDGFHPVPPLAAFRVVSYRRDQDPVGRPYAAFRLLQPETGKNQTYAATDPVKVAGMIRGAAGKAALDSLPDDKKAWVEKFVYGHHDGADSFPRFSYLPLPSIQPVVGVGRINRVLIAEPIAARGNEVAWIKRLLAGYLANNEQGRHALLMTLSHDDNVLKQYVATSQTWNTVTPVALPGSDDGIASKTSKLLAKMFNHAGYSTDSVEELEYHRVPFCRGAEDAKRYRPRAPHHLANCTMYHMRIRWKFPMPGPIALGAGRHCGLGVFAAIEL